MILYDKHPTGNKNHTQDLFYISRNFFWMALREQIESPASTFSHVSKRSHVSPIKRSEIVLRFAIVKSIRKAPLNRKIIKKVSILSLEISYGWHLERK